MRKQSDFHWVDFSKYLIDQYLKGNEFLYDSFYHDFYLRVKDAFAHKENESLRIDFELFIARTNNVRERARFLNKFGTQEDWRKDTFCESEDQKAYSNFESIVSALNIPDNQQRQALQTLREYSRKFLD